MKISINLATEPFVRMRPTLVASGAAAVALVGLLGLLISISVTEKGQAAQTMQSIAKLEAQSRTIDVEQAKVQTILRKPENAEVLERSLFLNSLLQAKGISWTRLFDDLGKVMPHNVRLMQIRPQVNADSGVALEMVVGAESSAPVISMLVRMERSTQFSSPQLYNSMPPSQTEPLWRHRLSVNYTQKL